MPQTPLISVLIPTRDRPRLLGLALQYYNYQSYPNKEVIVIDDGELFPVDQAAVEAVGGRLIRVPTGTPTGTKLNAGAEQAKGTFCQRMDDDDYYAPEFMERMIAGALEHQEDVCLPTLSFLAALPVFRGRYVGNPPVATRQRAGRHHAVQPERLGVPPIPADDDR